jgi:hypothetical protein
MRTYLKNFGLVAAIALTVAATAGAAEAQYRGGGGYHGGGHYYGGGYRGGGYRGYGPGYGFAGGLAVGSALGYGAYGYGNCYRRVFIDRYGYRRVRRVCY